MNQGSEVVRKSAAAVRDYFTDYRTLRKEKGLRWWVEILVIAVFYGIYSLIRNQFGSDTVAQSAEILTGAAKDAYENAKDVIAVERFFRSIPRAPHSRYILGLDLVHQLLECVLRFLPFRYHHGCAGVAVCALS